ncbi:hypothetical protein ACQ86N_41195 [Puia sp. P3]|uniref:hypothetical protein n=1 Tax=Puia sp. P3 TaxID=3423952 RepID=UPI003D67E900
MKASATSVVPPFKPFAGKKMLVGAWVKEEDSCTCQTYANNHILVGFSLSGGGRLIRLAAGFRKYDRRVAALRGSGDRSGKCRLRQSYPSGIGFVCDLF